MADAPAAEPFAFPGLPERVIAVLARLTDAGHEAALVGGVVRDRLLGLEHAGDWDIATSGRPEQVAQLFDGSTWQNRFGTVTVGAHPAVEITSYRTEGSYRDRRRPEEVQFGASLAEDLARRDFTINAIAWRPTDLSTASGKLVDPHGGAGDLQAGVLRTVGNPSERFTEDALRLLRAVRFAGRFGLEIEPETRVAIVELAQTVSSVSGERLRDELLRILAGDAPGASLRLLESLGLLRVVLPELVALRGVPQAKRTPGDALDHTFAAVDAVPAGSHPDARLTALLHDLGKATTLADGHFIDHERVGAELARRVLERLRVGRSRLERIVRVIEQHMYHYEPAWSDAAVRRFVRRVSSLDRELLFTLRRADNLASGEGEEGDQDQRELEDRIARELAHQPDLLLDRRLAIDGHDLQEALGLAPGPQVGEILDRLSEVVLDDPDQNDRETLLRLARALAEER